MTIQKSRKFWHIIVKTDHWNSLNITKTRSKQNIVAIFLQYSEVFLPYAEITVKLLKYCSSCTEVDVCEVGSSEQY